MHYIHSLSDLIPEPQAFHQLFGPTHLKVYTHWNETETKQLQNNCETVLY